MELDFKKVNEELEKASKTDGICHCPLSEIQYLVGASDNLEWINVKTGKCLRCGGTRLSKFSGKILKGKRRIK
jgi:hypothetical protein